jgi:hypothetical protein
MTKRIILVLILFLITSFIFSDQSVITDDGEKVILKDDGTWYYINTGDSSHIAKMSALLTFIAKTLVDNPAIVETNVIQGEKSTIIELKVAQEDIKKIIGKSGRIAKAIRTIISAAGAKMDMRVVLEILY